MKHFICLLAVLAAPLLAGNQAQGTPSSQARDAALQGCSPGWMPTFGGQPGTQGMPLVMTAFDDGTGPALYVGGELISANGQPLSRIGRWDGDSWSPLGSGVNGFVRALVVFDDGSGPALFVGGEFTMAGGQPANRIAKWDGQGWSALGGGLNGNVEALTIFDDGSGEALYVGGYFTNAGGQPASRIARWDGSVWSELGLGMGADGTGWPPEPPAVLTLTTFDDGAGTALFAGGLFNLAGGQSAQRVAKWDGQAWSPLGSGVSNAFESVFALATFDDGSGTALYVGGAFYSAGGVSATGIVRWDGQGWSGVGGGLGGYVRDFLTYDDGTGPALYVGGSFHTAGGATVKHVARWDGQSWSAVGTGMTHAPNYSASVWTLAAFDDGSGSTLFAGGWFLHADGQPVNRIASWDGTSWGPLNGAGLEDQVKALATYDDGTGPALYAGGRFTSTGGMPASRIARWDGQTWSALGSGISGINNVVEALEVFDDGSGPALYVGGSFNIAGGLDAPGLARWNGQEWSSVPGSAGTVLALVTHDDGSGPALFVGGTFHFVDTQNVNRIAKWDGHAWSKVGDGGLAGDVLALTTFDDGSGPALYAGGRFQLAGGESASRIARWDGQAWSTLGSGMETDVWALASFDDGSGPALYAGGAFTLAGGISASRIARWDGQTWSAMGTGMNGNVQSFFSFDTGSGPLLYAGGNFTSAGGQPANRIARWDGQVWSPLGPGLPASALAITAFNDGSGDGPAIFVGGAFSWSPGGDSFLAKWACESPPPITSFCGGDGSSTACPCSNDNDGSLGIAGCANSTFASGCQIATGGSYPGSVAVLVEKAQPSTFGLVLRGTAQVDPPFQHLDGLLCVGGSTWRSSMILIDPLGQAKSELLPQGPLGEQWTYQFWYRDSGLCSGSNLSNGLGITW